MLLSKVVLLIVALMALIGMVVFAVTGNIPQIPGAGALVGFAEALHVTAIGGVMVSPFVVPVVLFANAEVAEKIAEWMATKSKPADSGAPDSFSVYE